MLCTVVTAILFYLINATIKMADFATYCRSAIVEDVGLSDCMNHQLEVDTDHGALKQTKSKINVDHRSSITEVFPVTNCSCFQIVF